MLFPFDASAVGREVDNLFYLALSIISIAFVLVVGILAYFILRYRARAGNHGYYTHGDSRKAVTVTILFALVVFFAVDVNLAIHDHFAWEKTWGKPPRGDAVLVEVMPQQFAWNIRYAGADRQFGTPDDIVTINEMHVPVNRPVIVALQSKDVVHSFFLPNFRIKQDAVPGMVTSLFFMATQEGTYDIACAEHCGLGHYRMRGALIAESEQAFQEWIQKQAVNATPDVSWGWPWGSSK